VRADAQAAWLMRQSDHGGLLLCGPGRHGSPSPRRWQAPAA